MKATSFQTAKMTKIMIAVAATLMVAGVAHAD